MSWWIGIYRYGLNRIGWFDAYNYTLPDEVDVDNNDIANYSSDVFKLLVF